MLVLILSASGCVTSFKLVKDYNSKVLSRPSQKECPLIWIAMYENFVEEVYGEPCHIIIRKEKFVK